MHETLRVTRWAGRCLGAALVFGWIVTVGLIVLLWEAAGAFLGIGLFVHYGFGLMASAHHFYRLSAATAGLALLAHAGTGLWPFQRRRRDG